MNTEMIASMLAKMSHPIDPPGCQNGIIEHPHYRNKAVEILRVLPAPLHLRFLAKAARQADTDRTATELADD